MGAPEVEALTVSQWMEIYKLFLRIQKPVPLDFDTGKIGGLRRAQRKRAPKGPFCYQKF